MFKILLWITIGVVLTACQITENNKPEESTAKEKTQDKDANSVLELRYDEVKQRLVLQETSDISGENIVNIPENSFENANDTRVSNNDNVIVKYEGEKNKEEVATTDLVEPVSETIIIVETPKMKFPGIDTVNNIDLTDENIPSAEEFKGSNLADKNIPKAKELKEPNLADEKKPKIEELKGFNLENPETLEMTKDNGTGVDVIFDKEEVKLEQKVIKPKYNLGSGANVVFAKEANSIDLSEDNTIKLSMDVKSLANRKQPILENQLKKQYKKEQEKEIQKNIVVKNRSTREISRDIFDKFSREINKDISRLENIKKSYQNIDKSTAYIKNDNNDNAALNLLENAYYANQTADITDISLESIKKVVTKAKQNKKGAKNNFLNELLKSQNHRLKPIKKGTKKQHNLLTLSLSNVQKVIEQQENALKDDTKMWQSIDKKSNKLMQEKIKNNQLLKIKLAKLKKQLNGSGILKMSKTQLRHIIEELNQLDIQLNRPNKLLNKKVNQSDIDKLLQELKKAKY